jgi:hypothetical protein
MTSDAVETHMQAKGLLARVQAHVRLRRLTRDCAGSLAARVKILSRVCRSDIVRVGRLGVV